MKKAYKDKRITVRVTLAEWFLLKKMADRAKFATVSGMLRCIIYSSVRDFDRLLQTETGSCSIGDEIGQMFRDCEDEGLKRMWKPDINQRK